MSNTGKIITSIVGFIVCAFLGYAVTELVSRTSDRSDSSVAQSYSGGGAGGGKFPESHASPASPAPSAPQAPAEVPASSAPAASAPQAPAASEQPVVIPSQPVQETPRPAEAAPQTGDYVPRDAPKDIPTGNSLSASGMRPEILSVSKPQFDEKSNTYSFEVTASGNGLTYVLADKNKKDISAQQSSAFRGVAGTSSGKYYVYVKDNRGQQSEYFAVEGCVTHVKRIDAAELQRVLNSKDSNEAVKADFKNRVAASCRYEFRGRDESEGDAPRTYNDIILRLRMRTWASVQVLSVVYGDSGKMIKAVIQVNY
jgi:hypothetical protein